MRWSSVVWSARDALPLVLSTSLLLTGVSPAAMAQVRTATGAPAERTPLVVTPYPGTIALDVDATDLTHRIFRTHERIPVQPGALTLRRSDQCQIQ